MEEEEKSKEMEDLYLPPRSRKTLQQANQGEGVTISQKHLYFLLRERVKSNVYAFLYLGKSKKRKKTDDSDEDDEGSDADGSDDEKPKKRGRPRVTPRENIKSFTDVEVRNRFFSFSFFSPFFPPLKSDLSRVIYMLHR